MIEYHEIVYKIRVQIYAFATSTRNNKVVNINEKQKKQRFISLLRGKVVNLRCNFLKTKEQTYYEQSKEHSST